MKKYVLVCLLGVPALYGSEPEVIVADTNQTVSEGDAQSSTESFLKTPVKIIIAKYITIVKII